MLKCSVTHQADVVTEAGEVEEEQRHDVVAVAPNLPVTVQKTNRVDVTDRFGKFDIRQELERKTSSHLSGSVLSYLAQYLLVRAFAVAKTPTFLQ